jgi:hypothetical protein
LGIFEDIAYQKLIRTDTLDDTTQSTLENAQLLRYMCTMRVQRFSFQFSLCGKEVSKRQNYGHVTRRRLTVTEDGDACAVLLIICIESCGCLALGCNMGSKYSYGRFNLLGFLTLAFQHCRFVSAKARHERAR